MTMIKQAFVASIRGLPHNPAVTEINTRSGPATTYDSAFKAVVGTQHMPILAVKADENKTVFQGKVYQWFQLSFPDGRQGWVRDDLLSINGDGAEYGYGMVAPNTFAFAVTRQEAIAVTAAPAPSHPAQPAPSNPAPAPAATSIIETVDPAPEATALTNIDRIRIAAFNITAGFEGGGYATYQNYDAGIISYGRFQFTLAGSGLYRVLELYTGRSTSPTANELRSAYVERTRNHDAGLRHDQRLRQLLIEAAQDSIMQQAQDQVATEQYWNVVQDLSIKPRNIRTPLGIALIFDMGINFGPRHGFLTRAEQETGLQPRTLLPDEATERRLITRLAELRRDSHYRQAERDRLPGLKVRGDFWVKLAQQGDWQISGDASGLVEIKPGARIKVRNF